MKPSYFFLIGLLFSIRLSGQDVVQTSEGEVTIHPVLHGSLVLKSPKGTIFIDPYGGSDRFAQFGVPDYILITDIHGDHLHRETLEGLDLTKATFIVPKAVADRLKNQDRMVILSNGTSKNMNGLGIQAMPMYNLPETEDSRHPKGRGNGYIISLGETDFYISGDTEDIPEMKALKDIEVAFICMNLPYTMSIEQASDAVLAFEPKIVYPFHFRGQGGFSDVQKFKQLVNEKNPSIEIRLRNWYPN